MAKNRIVHFEFRTRDVARLQDFYGGVFNWKFEQAAPEYTMIRTKNEELGGGILQLGELPMPTGLTNFVEVEDLDAYEEKIKGKGGQVTVSKREIPGWGTMSVFTDVDNNLMAMWSAPKRPKALKKIAKKAKKTAKHEKKEKKKKKN